MFKLVPDVTQKFVLVRFEGDNSLSFLGDPNITFHKEIIADYTSLGHTIESVHGGGKVCCLTENKIVYVWGSSTNYGDFSFPEVENILNDQFPDFAIKNFEPEQDK